MSRRERVGGCLAVLVVAAALAGVVGTGQAAVHIVPPDIPEMALHGNFAPRALSRTKPTAGVLDFSGEIKMSDGSRPPALEQLVVEADRDIDIDARGLPSCRFHGVPDVPPSGDCGRAVVGRGTVSFEVLFEETTLVPVKGRLTVYDSGVKRGVTSLVARTSIDFPVPATVVFPIEVKKASDSRFGTEAVVSVPKVAGGAGSVTGFRLRLGKRLVDRGRLLSLVSLTCSDGEIGFRATGLFRDGTTIVNAGSRPCSAKG